MKPAGLVLAICILVCGCSSGASFKPKTAEGANCKAKCASDMALCQSSREICEEATSTCMTACKELDDIKRSEQ